MSELQHVPLSPNETAGVPVSRGKRTDDPLRDCAAYRRNLQTEKFEFMSPVIESITGYSAQEMSAMSLEEWLARVHTEDNLRMIFEFERIAEGAEPSSYTGSDTKTAGTVGWLTMRKC